jgi:hypothetical protein
MKVTLDSNEFIFFYQNKDKENEYWILHTPNSTYYLWRFTKTPHQRTRYGEYKD